jgi:hypothetical protein
MKMEETECSETLAPGNNPEESICQILKKLEFSVNIFEKHSNFMQIRPVGVEFFHTNGRTEGQMTK